VDSIKYREAYPDVVLREVSDLTTRLSTGDGVPLLADFGIENYEAGIDSKLIRSPEEILKSPWDKEVQIWATAIVVKTPQSKQ
jgi:hypothetical protein